MKTLSNFEIRLLAIDMIVRELILTLDEKDFKKIRNNLDENLKNMSSDVFLSQQDVSRLCQTVKFMFLHSS